MIRKHTAHDDTLAAIEHLDPASPGTQEILASTCIHNPHGHTRRVAMGKLTDPALLARVAKQAGDYDVYKEAIERLDDNALLEDIAQYPCEAQHACILSMHKIDDQDILLRIAHKHPFTDVRIEAITSLADTTKLVRIATENTDPAVRAAAAVRIRDDETISHLACMDPNRSVRKAAISTLSSIEKLTTIAIGSGPDMVRRSALQRMAALAGEEGLEPHIAARLLPCLKESRLIAYAISLMETSGVDWCAHFSESNVLTLCDAWSECGISRERSILEGAYTQLYQDRVDLRSFIHPHLPQSLPSQAAG